MGKRADGRARCADPIRPARRDRPWRALACLVLLALPLLPLHPALGQAFCGDIVEESFDLDELDQEETSATVETKDLSLKKTAWALLPACLALMLLWPRRASRTTGGPTTTKSRTEDAT